MQYLYHIKCIIWFHVHVVAEHFYTSDRAIGGLTYWRFKAIRHKLHCQLPYKKPLVIGRKGWIQRALCEMLAAEKARQPNTSKHSTQDHIKIQK